MKHSENSNLHFCKTPGEYESDFQDSQSCKNKKKQFLD